MPLDPTTLTSERLVLRPLRAADADALFAIFSDSAVTRYWSSTAWTTMQQARDYIAAAAEGLASGSALRLGIELAASGELVGQAALYAFQPANRRCDAGYALARAHWGKGYVSEAMTALLEHGFGALDLNRVEADIDPRNTASARALTRLGFEREGLLRERWMVGGEITDTEFYGLLKRDWEYRVTVNRAG